MIGVIVTGILEALIAGGAIYYIYYKNQSSVKKGIETLRSEVKKRQELLTRISEIYSQMIDLGTATQTVEEYRALEEEIKTEQGRLTIGKAELETVEIRLRELEEIERELEASTLETKKEMEILEKKQAELKQHNEELKQKVAEIDAQTQQLLDKVEMDAQAAEQINNMKQQIIETEQRIDNLYQQIEDGNEQYFILKKRYDALDIEYAQLYEKFLTAEEKSDN